MKETFILYTEYAKHLSFLSMNQRGVLFTAIINSQAGEELPDMDSITQMAFSFISADLERTEENYRKKIETNRENGRKGGRPKTERLDQKPNGFEEKPKKPNGYFENPNELDLDNDLDNDISSVGLNAGVRAREAEEDEAAETVEGYLKFLKEHPSVEADLTNPSLISAADYETLSEKISESRFLQTRKSLNWLLSNYRKIVADGYKDFDPHEKADRESGKGDLQLWQELVKARGRAKEYRYCADTGQNLPLYAMGDDCAKKEMGTLYKELSPEIQAYFDPNSFLELCEMEEKELKFERARFLKELGGIRQRLKSEVKYG